MNPPTDRRRDVRRRVLGRRRFAGLVLGCVLALNTGCYEYRPYESAGPQPGDRVALELSDQGRVGLSSLLGPGVLRVEGTVLQATAQEYVLGVSSVSTISGGTSNWTGDRVTIPVSDVSQTRLRTVSKVRSALLAGVVVVGIGVVIATRGLFNMGNTATSDTSASKPILGT